MGSVLVMILTTVTKHAPRTTEERKVGLFLFGCSGWAYSPSRRSRHGARSVGQLVTLHLQYKAEKQREKGGVAGGLYSVHYLLFTHLWPLTFRVALPFSVKPF